MQNYHVTHKNGEWRFAKEGSSRAIKTAETKADTVQAMQEYMNDGHAGSVKIHKLDGTVQEERTYPGANDPKRTPG